MISFAAESLARNRLRAVLSLLGIVIGTFAITVMLGVSDIARGTIVGQLRQVTGRSILVQPSNTNRGVGADRLTSADAELIGGVYGAHPLPQNFSFAQYDNGRGQPVTITVTSSVGDVPRIDATTRVQTGRYFNAFEADNGAPVGVLNARAARDLFGERDPVGRTVVLAFQNGVKTEVTIVGVLEPLPGLFSAMSTPQVVVPNAFLWQRSNSQAEGTFDVVQVIVDDQVGMAGVSRKIEQLLAGNHEDGKFTVQSTDLFANVIDTVTGIVTVVLATVGGLSLLVAGIGIMNMMLVSVNERLRDIGLLVALGAHRETINAMFLLEALLLTGVGGGLGSLLALALLWGVTALLPVQAAFHVGWFTLLIPFGVSVVIGLLFGVLPASRAAALDPIECLRFE
nr:ABC transporter permease [Deinococcus aestuarii]